MPLQRPRFQIDGEFFADLAGSTVPNSGGSLDLVDVVGPGLVKEASYSFNSTAAGNFGSQRIVITVDGTIIFDLDIEEAELLTESGVSGSIGDFHVDITLADDTFDMTLKDMAFISEFKIQLFNDAGANWDLDITGATLWHKGA